jgi:hypothetical protein
LNGIAEEGNKMSTVQQVLPSTPTWEMPVTGLLDDDLWGAWVLRGRARESRGRVERLTAVTSISIATLIAASALWSHLGAYETVVRFIVALGATTVMAQSLHMRQYAGASVFAALALLFNPIAPAFAFSGAWQRMFVMASTVPFVTALAWAGARRAGK